MHLSVKSPTGVGGTPPKYDFLTFNRDAPGEARGMQTEATVPHSAPGCSNIATCWKSHKIPNLIKTNQIFYKHSSPWINLIALADLAVHWW